MSSMNITPEQAQRTRRTSQLKLLGVFAIAGVPVALAMIMYFGNFAVPMGKTNHGNLLIPALSLNELGVPQNQEGFYDLNQENWLILQVGSGACNTQCTDMLHTARQVNVAMGREMDRVARVLVLDQNSALDPAVSENYLHLTQLQASIEQQKQFLANAKLSGANDDLVPDQWSLWLVDPLGNIMMQYDASHDGYDLIGDLKKLLKLSNIG